jgi:hypothetical protein
MAKVLKSYAMVQARIGDERLAQDGAIQTGFLQPWQTSLNLGLQAAMKSRQNVRSARYVTPPNKLKKNVDIYYFLRDDSRSFEEQVH